MNVRYILARNSNNRSFFFAQQLDLFSSLMATFVTGKKEKKKKGKKSEIKKDPEQKILLYIFDLLSHVK